MAISLVGRSHPYIDIEIAVDHWPFRIGRHPECDLILLHAAVSKRHCQINRRGEVVLVEDSSRNGTFVNGMRVDQEHVLKLGDRLQVGTDRFDITFCASGDEFGESFLVTIVEYSSK